MRQPQHKGSARIPTAGAAAIGIGLLWALASLPSFAASQCKGLAKSQCDSSASCTWVSGYKTDKGNRVSAYCRSKSAKTKSPTTSQSVKQKTATKEKKKTRSIEKSSTSSAKGETVKSKQNTQKKESKKASTSGN